MRPALPAWEEGVLEGPLADWIAGARPARVRERRDEAIPAAGNCRDEARTPVVVPQLQAQGSDVAIHHVAFSDEVGPPDRVQDVFSRDDTPAAARQQIQQALLDATQVHDGAAGAYP